MTEKNDEIMYLGVCRILIAIPGSETLKEKRHVVRSLLARLRNTFDALSVAEIGALDETDEAIIGLACVSNSTAVADAIIAKAVAWVEDNTGDSVLEDYETSIVRAF